jgi:hypothetical protein
MYKYRITVQYFMNENVVYDMGISFIVIGTQSKYICLGPSCNLILHEASPKIMYFNMFVAHSLAG